MKALAKIKEVAACLRSCGIDDADKEAEIFLTQGIGIDRVTLYRDDPTLSEDQIKRLEKILQRRAKREPLQYILGYAEFYGMNIKVGPGVLIPRSETELIVEEVIKIAGSRQSAVKKKSIRDYRLQILDFCTGSGCLALAIAKHLPVAAVYGTDISEIAVEYAMENAKINRIKNVTFLKGHLFEPVKDMRFDMIVSNPPYIKRRDIQNLQPEIREWEPVEALDGGEDGLKFYKEILQYAPEYLNDNGFVIIESGQGQANDVIKIAEGSKLKNISIIKDYAGIERILIWRN